MSQLTAHEKEVAGRQFWRSRKWSRCWNCDQRTHVRWSTIFVTDRLNQWCCIPCGVKWQTKEPM